MVSFMTLQKSMDEKKLKNYQAFDHNLLSLLCVCVCVCVCVCLWVGCLFSVTGIKGGLIRETDRERERILH